MTNMRAKVRVAATLPMQQDGVAVSERLMFSGVAKSGSYPADGSDEDNTFAKFSPSVSIDMHVANPALFGKFEVGQKFYVDFSPAE